MNKLASPDLALVNGVIRTQDPDIPFARALAIKGDRITAVGDDNTIIALCDKSTKLMQLNGALVLPGFMDCHIHLFETCFFSLGLDLKAVACLEDLQQKIADRARYLPAGDWIWGNGWFEPGWPEARLPCRRDLDAVTSDHPVLLWRADLHLAVANSKALEIAGISPRTPDPPFGVIDRHQNGQPTGVLRDLAINLVKKVMPRPEYNQLETALEHLTSRLHACGITAVHNVHLMGGLDAPASLSFFQQAKSRGRLKLRCWSSLAGELLDQALALGLTTGFGDCNLMIGHLKYFADGSMGARTAWQTEPYLDGGRGMALVDPRQLADNISRAHRAGLAVMVHAIGDRTCKTVIDILESIEAATGNQGPALAHRIEHLQMVRQDDLKRLSQLKVVASVQPANLIDDISMLETALGPLAGRCYVFGEMASAGIKLVFGSDHPVCSYDPLLGIQAAALRQRTDGTPPGGWFPGQRLAIGQCVAAYTSQAAEAAAAGTWLGSVTAGKKADLVVLDRDIVAEPSQIAGTKVLATFFDGRPVFTTDRFATASPE